MAVWAYCLMPNHVHLIIVPSDPDGLRAALAEAHRRYTRAVNFRDGWLGYPGAPALFIIEADRLKYPP